MADVDRVAAHISYGGSVRAALEHVPGWSPKDPSAALGWLVKHEAEVAQAVQRYDQALQAVEGDAARALFDRLVGKAVDNLGTAAVALVGKDVPIAAGALARADAEAGERLLAGLREMVEG